MNRLAQTDLHVPSLFLILGTGILFFAPISSLGEQPMESVERESLHGVTGVEVLVDPLDVEIEQLGVKTDSLQKDLTQRVRLESRETSELSAVTWMKLGPIGIVADDNVKHIEGQVLQKTDQFIKDYLAANPDRRVKH